MSNIINDAFNSIDPESEKFVNKNIDIVEEIYALLEEKGISQKEFAEMMGKNQSEISKYLSGMHNLTLRSIAKIEVALGQDIIITCSRAKEKYEKINYVFRGNRTPKNKIKGNSKDDFKTVQIKAVEPNYSAA